MAEITLRDYIEEIDILIENEQLDEAIAHCLHILQAYPKHIEAYRHLGKALLEAGRFTEAADMFQRVLAAVPDDFVSHVGMSVIREDEGNLDTAIWHMQRAYETSPANTTIKEELKQLIAQREGIAPAKPGLTRGALAQMYVRGELYQEAIVELQASLEEEPDRPDLQVILAEVYWRTGQRVEAAEVCSDLLEELPFCQVANRIMAAMLQTSEQAEEGTVYHRRLAALDPYSAFVENAMMDPDTVPDDAVKLKRMDWQPGAPIPAVESGLPDWAAEIGLEIASEPEEAVEAEPEGEIEEPAWLEDIGMASADSDRRRPMEEPAGEEPDEELPAWLEEIEPDEDLEPLAEAEEAPGTPPFMEDEMEGEEEEEGQIPGWMEQAGWRESEGEVEEAHVSFSDEELAALEAGALPEDDLGEEGEEGELAPAEIPDWLMEIAPEEAAEEEAEVRRPADEDDVFAEVLRQEEEADIEEPPDWLSGIAPESEELEEFPSEVDEPAVAEEIDTGAEPDWMSGIEPEEEELEAAEETPDWLSGITPEPAETEVPEGEEAAAPDWLSGVTSEAEAEELEVPASEEEPEPAGVEPTEEWAAGETMIDFSAAEEPEREGEAEADLDWLRGIGGAEEIGEMAAPVDEPEEPEPEEEAAEWLSGIARTAEEISVDAGEQATEMAETTPERLEEPEAPQEEEALPEEEAPAIPSWLAAEEPGESSTIVSWLGTQQLEEEDEGQVEEEEEEPVSEAPPFLSAVDEVEDEAPSWLSEAAATAERFEQPAEDLEIEPAPEPEESMEPEAAGAAFEGEAEEAESLLMDELESTDQVPELSQEADTPEWLRGYAEEISEPSEGMEEGEPAAMAEEAEPASELEPAPEVGEPSMEGPAADTEPPVPAREEPPEGELEPEPPGEISAEPAPEAEAEVTGAEPDWLGELAEERGIEEHVREAPEAEPEPAETPEWLQEISEEPVIPSEQGEPEEMPSFAQELPGGDEETDWEEAAAAEPDWLKEAEPEPESVEILEEPEIPDWLREPDEDLMAPEPEVQIPAEELEREEAPPEPEFAKSDTKPLVEPEPPEPEVEAPAEEVAVTEPEVQPEFPPAEPTVAEERPETVEAPAESEEAVPTETPEVVEPAPLEREPAEFEPADLLQAAQAALRERDYERAAEQYAQLTRKKQALNATIDDLEETLEDHPAAPKLWTVLGDAYMQMDRIAEAIEAYQRGVEVV